jgi:hypothetical protein
MSTTIQARFIVRVPPRQAQPAHKVPSSKWITTPVGFPNGEICLLLKRGPSLEKSLPGRPTWYDFTKRSCPMLCSHRLPYEQRCPFCFEAAMEVERLRTECSKQSALLPSGRTSNDGSRSRSNRHSGNERRRMVRGSIPASACSDRRCAGSLDRQRAFGGLG